MKYNKPPIDIPAQINLLKSRRLKFKDESKAAHYLSNISYYRLRAYTYPFQDNTNNHEFASNVFFEDIIELYVFDRKLRLLVFDAIEKIEIALRTKIIYHFALKNGSHWHEDKSLYRNYDRYIQDRNKLYEEIKRSTETFIKHYEQKYSDPHNPPSWMSLEVISMGLLSRIFSNLKISPEKKQILNSFKLKSDEVLESWMHSISQVRNICAHHSRLWNRRITAKPMFPKSQATLFLNNTSVDRNKLYAVLSCITYILHIISPGNNFNNNLKNLLKGSKLVNYKEMGFPEDWETETIWQ